MNKQLLSKLIPLVFYALLIAFLFVYIQTLEWSKLENVSISWLYVAVATLFGVGFRYWGSFIWFVLLRHLGAHGIWGQKMQLVYVYAKSWLGRYIPGTAPWILGKIYFASKMGISKNKLAVSSLLEGALQVSVTLAIAFAILVFDTRLDVIDTGAKLIMAALLIGCLLLIVPPVFNRLIAVTYKLLRKKTFPAEHYATNRTIISGASLYVFGSLLSGLSFFFIAKAVYGPLSYADMLFVLGASNLASAASMIAVFAPSGIGVREGIQVLLLSLVMPPEFAILIAVITRIWSVAIDLLFFGVTWLAYRIHTHLQK